MEPRYAPLHTGIHEDAKVVSKEGASDAKRICGRDNKGLTHDKQYRWYYCVERSRQELNLGLIEKRFCVAVEI